MFLKRMWPFFFLPLLVGLGCSQRDGGASPPSADVVASFNGGVITRGQLKAKFESLLPCCKGRYQGEEGARNLVKEMVLPTVITQAIKQKKMDLRENIREELGNLTEELNMSFLHMKFHEQIMNADEKYRDLRESYETQRAILKGYPLSERFDRLVQLHQKIHLKMAKEVEEVSQEYIRKLRSDASITKNFDVLRVKVTQAELKDFYQRHKEGLHGDEYRVPQRARVEEIRIRVEKEEGDCPACASENERKARDKAESALNELGSGAEFRTVAEKYTSDATEALKSEWVARGRNGKEFDEVVFSLDVGETSRAFKEGDVFHIVKVLDKEAGRLKTYGEIKDQIEREYRWQKGEDYLRENSDRILFTINGKPYTIGDFIKAYTRNTPSHQCHHMEKMDKEMTKDQPEQLCDFAHNDIEEQKKLVNRMIDGELVLEDTYNQMIHVEHQQEIEFMTMASLYPIFHKEEMKELIHITDKMVEDYYEKNKEDYLYPAKVKVSLLVSRGGGREEEKKKAFEKAKRAHEELKPSLFSFKKGKNFAEIVRKYSDDAETASRGGRVDVDIYECRSQIEYMLLHGFHKKIFELKPGEISDIFEFGGDYYIVQMREMESRKQEILEEVREQVKKDIMKREHREVMKTWEDDLMKSAGFTVYDENLMEAMTEASAGTEVSKTTKGS